MNRNNARHTRQGNNKSSGNDGKHGIYQHTRSTHSHRNDNNYHNSDHHIRRRQKVALLGLASRILHIFHPIPEEKPPVLSLPLLLQLQRKVLVGAPTRTRMADDHCGHAVEIFVNPPARWYALPSSTKCFRSPEPRSRRRYAAMDTTGSVPLNVSKLYNTPEHLSRITLKTIFGVEVPWRATVSYMLQTST